MYNLNLTLACKSLEKYCKILMDNVCMYHITCCIACEQQHACSFSSCTSLPPNPAHAQYAKCKCPNHSNHGQRTYLIQRGFNIVILSMEPRKQIITIYNKYSLTSYSISCRHITLLQKHCNCQQTKCYTCYYRPKMIKTILSTCYVHTHH